MKQTIQRMLAVALSAVLLCGFIAVPVSAEHGEDDEVTTTATVSPKPTGSDDSEDHAESESHSSGRRRGASKESVESKVEEARKKAEEKVAEIKAKASEKSEEQRGKSCEARKANIEQRMERTIQRVQKHKEVFDKILDRSISFVSDKNLTVENYDALVTNAQAAGDTVDASVAALDSLDITIDCSDTDAVANAITTFKEATAETREALKAYRTAIKVLIQNIKASAQSDDDTDSPSPTASPSPTDTNEDQ